MVSLKMMNKLDSKKEQLLKAIIKEYVHTASPVASLNLGEHYGLESSSATLRNWMGELENLGYLQQPHPSSGRIPTDLGYRHYVDLLMERENLTAREKRLIQRELEAGFHEIEDLVREAAEILSHIGHCAALAIPPVDQTLTLKSLQLVRLGKEKILLVLLTENGMVFDRVMEMELSRERLEAISRLLNQKLRGLSLSRIGPHLLEGTADQMVAELLGRILELIAQTVEFEKKNRLLVEGMHLLLDQPEFRDLNRVKSTLEVLEQEDRITRFLGRMKFSPDVNVFIGNENPLKDFQELTVIAVPYGGKKSWFGTLALVGPTRMDYDRLIPLIEYTASVLTSRLQQILA